MKVYFLDIINWLHDINASFGVDNVEIEGRVFWLDAKEDLSDLYKMYKRERGDD